MTTVQLSEITAKLESGSRPKGGVGINGDIPSLGGEHLTDDGGFNLGSPKRISDEFYSTLRSGRISIQDILIVKDGATTGRTCFVDSDFPFEKAAINEHVFRLEIDPKVALPKYVYHYLRSPRGRAGIMSDFRGATVGGISRGFIEKVKIPLPSLPEQQRIAAILDQADALRAKRRQIISHLTELEQAIFLSMFGHDRDLRPVSELCELVVDCVNRTAPVVESVTPYKMLRTTNIRNGAVDTTNVRYVEQTVFEKWNRRATPRRGDVILTREAPVGEAGVLFSDDNVFLGQRLMLYRVDPAKMTPDYLAACFRSPVLQEQFNRLGSGSTVKHLPLPACRNFQIPVAPISDQERFSERVASINALRVSIQVQMTSELGLFGALQARAFRGEL